MTRSSDEPNNGRGNGRKKRKTRQRKRQMYMELREDLQLSGDIPTTPEGAIRNEVVPPCADPPIPELVQQAVRRGWAVPEERKPGIVDEMLKVIDNPEESAKVKVAAFNAVRMADQQQYERDHPQRAGQAKGGTTVNVPVAVQAKIDIRDTIAKMVMNGEVGCIELPAPPESSPPGD